MKIKYYIGFILIFSLFCAFETLLPLKKITPELISKQEKFIAGNEIKISFKTSKNASLFIIHSYGKTLINGINKNGTLHFIVPKIYSQKTGFVSWFLVHENENLLNGNFEIVPNDNTKTLLESYLGPPSTLVSDNHFVMFVTIPTDSFDNPKLPNTNVEIKNQFLNSIENQNIPTKDFIAWKNIYAPTKSGTVLISAECNSAITKEFDALIYPSTATNFTINYTRNHEFADGNQLTTLNTSVIKDKFGNIVSDGTHVLFSITTKNNAKLFASGNTIEGIATTKIMHPDCEEKYAVKAFVTGMASSNPISILYKPVNPEINYLFSNGNRTLTVGPLKSFMNQIMPDGIKVELKMYQNNKLIATLQENSLKGKAVFIFPKEFYKAAHYTFEITTLGKTIKTDLVKL